MQLPCPRCKKMYEGEEGQKLACKPCDIRFEYTNYGKPDQLMNMATTNMEMIHEDWLAGPKPELSLSAPLPRLELPCPRCKMMYEGEQGEKITCSPCELWFKYTHYGTPYESMEVGTTNISLDEEWVRNWKHKRTTS